MGIKTGEGIHARIVEHLANPQNVVVFQTTYTYTPVTNANEVRLDSRGNVEFKSGRKWVPASIGNVAILAIRFGRYE